MASNRWFRERVGEDPAAGEARSRLATLAHLEHQRDEAAASNDQAAVEFTDRRIDELVAQARARPRDEQGRFAPTEPVATNFDAGARQSPRQAPSMNSVITQHVRQLYGRR